MAACGFNDDLSGLRLTEARGRMEGVFAMQPRQHRLGGSTIVAFEQNFEGLSLPKRGGEVLGITEVRIIGCDFLQGDEVALPDGIIEAVRQLDGAEGAAPFLFKAHARNPVVERQDGDGGQGKGDEEATESTFHHAHGTFAAEHHGREIAREHEEELHAPAVDEAPHRRQEDAFAAVLDDPVGPRVSEARVQHDAEEHREAPEGVVVVPTFVGQAGRERRHPCLFVRGFLEFYDEPFQCGLRRCVRDFRGRGLQGRNIFGARELEEGLLGFEAEGFLGDQRAEAWAHRAVVAGDGGLDQGSPAREVELAIQDTGVEGVGHARAGDLCEGGDDVLVQGFILRELGQNRHGFGPADLSQGEGGFRPERRILLRCQGGDLRSGARCFRFRQGREEKACGFEVNLTQHRTNLCRQGGAGFVHHAFPEVIDGGPAHFHAGVGEGGECGALTLPE